MNEYLTEQEQIELLKNWIKQYSLVILSGVLLAVAVISGWRYWQQHKINVVSSASIVYDEMLTARAQNNNEAVLEQSAKLFNDYSGTVYGPFASLMLARSAILKKDYPEAEKQLQWAVDHSKTPAIREIARLRLARVMLAANKPQDALTVLAKVEDESFKGLIEEVKGDAYVAMKNTAMARKAYQEAIKTLPNADTIRPLLQMKYDNLMTS